MFAFVGQVFAWMGFWLSKIILKILEVLLIFRPKTTKTFYLFLIYESHVMD